MTDDRTWDRQGESLQPSPSFRCRVRMWACRVIRVRDMVLANAAEGIFLDLRESLKTLVFV